MHMDVGVHSYVYGFHVHFEWSRNIFIFLCVNFFSKSICFVSVDIRLVVKLVIRGLDHCVNRQSSRESIAVLLVDNWYFCSCTCLDLYICSHFYCVLCSFLFIIHITKSQFTEKRRSHPWPSSVEKITLLFITVGGLLILRSQYHSNRHAAWPTDYFYRH